MTNKQEIKLNKMKALAGYKGVRKARAVIVTIGTEEHLILESGESIEIGSVSSESKNVNRFYLDNDRFNNFGPFNEDDDISNLMGG